MNSYSPQTFRKLNKLIGWLVFALAASVYLLTMEPTASFWDCSEFIASGYKLEVGHPPGAPLFMLLVRFFTMFAPNTQTVPLFANALSALASAFTILLLFWSITHMVRKMITPSSGSYTITQLITILSSGAVGALAYTFSDSFWFSAVEGEVYATSSLFTALVFWAILKWEEIADQPHADRWLILIAYLMGLSIGIHLLNLLAIPAIVLVYYYKRYPVTRKGVIRALALSAILVLTVMYGIIQGLVILASKFELFFVNSVGLPIGSGITIYALLILLGLSYGIISSYRKKRVLLNSILTGIGVILIGYSSYTAIVIRSRCNPPMNQNSPDNTFSLRYYLNREQYGNRPLLYGQTFTAQPIERVNSDPLYIPKNGKYVPIRYRSTLKYDSRFEMLFPRMYSDNPQHIKAYKRWSGFTGKPVTINLRDGSKKTLRVPTFGENLRFFFRYQLGFMYFRYFMWNFAGRQNDMKGNGNVLRGNWICGIPFIDNARLGPQDKLPEPYRSNKARNRYYLLPLLLGIAGMLHQYRSDRKGFRVITALFVMTGIAIVVYLNQTPDQPRERDYAYVGSFYAFSIWIGLGVAALYRVISRIKDHPATALISASSCILLVPTLMASENWDDHTRAYSYIPTDFGYNMLIGCKPNAILFTYGDNDTFPLWYNQEVEGVRTDVRVSNLSYLRGDWYIEQMKHKFYQSDPIPIRMQHKHYFNSKRDVVLLFDQIKGAINLDQAVDFMLMDNPKAELESPFEKGKPINYLPSKSFYLPINKEEVIKRCNLSGKMAYYVLDTMQWSINKRMLLKDGQVILDLLATNRWKRPLYYGTTVNSNTYLGLNRFFHLEGLMYRILPIEAKSTGEIGDVNTSELYNNLMKRYRFRSIANPAVYLDENKTRIASSYRNLFARCANALYNENKPGAAKEVLKRCREVIPAKTVPHNLYSLSLIKAYYRLNDFAYALELSDNLAEMASEQINFILKLKKTQQAELMGDIRLNMAILQEILQMARLYNRAEHFKKIEDSFNRYISLLR